MKWVVKGLLTGWALTAAGLPWGALASRSVVTVVATGFTSDAGTARVALFNSEQGFPEDFSRAYKVGEAAIREGEACVVFSDVAYGKYAVVVLHDTNRNGVRDRNFFKVPCEAWGVSRNVPATPAPPRYADCMVGVYAPETRIEISMQN